jgi:hypothetical protein
VSEDKLPGPLEQIVAELEESVRVCREASALSDAERLALGMPIGETEQIVRRVRLEVLEGITAKAKDVLEKTRLAEGGCPSWVELNGARMTCEHPLGHEGEHRKKMVARVDKQRIDATMTWTMGAYLQSVRKDV